MSDAPIDGEALARVTQLLRLASAGADPDPGLTIPGDPAGVARSIDPDRLMGTVLALATGPRGPEDVQAIHAAAALVRDAFEETGLEPHTLPVDRGALSLPAIWVEIAGAAGAPRNPGPVPAVVLVGHYDTVPDSPGADDNASGVAAVLELARVLPRGVLGATVVLAAVPFEETGGLEGSTALAAELSRRADLRLVAAVSAEMLGFSSSSPRVDGDHGDDLLLVGFPGTEEVLATMLAAARAHSPGRVRGLAVPAGVPEVERSDHAAFHRVGVRAVMATDGAEFRNPHYHRASDLPDTLDAEFLAGSTASLAVGIMALASCS